MDRQNHLYNLIGYWQAKETAFKQAKEELDSAKAALIEFLDSPGTVQLERGWRLRYTLPTNYSWVKKGRSIDRDKIDAALNHPALFNFADDLVKWTPKLSVTVYDSLAKQQRDIIDEVIITDKGTAKLELLEPKADS